MNSETLRQRSSAKSTTSASTGSPILDVFEEVKYHSGRAVSGVAQVVAVIAVALMIVGGVGVGVDYSFKFINRNDVKEAPMKEYGGLDIPTKTKTAIVLYNESDWLHTTWLKAVTQANKGTSEVQFWKLDCEEHSYECESVEQHDKGKKRPDVYYIWKTEE